MKRIDVNYKWLIDDVLNKIDKEKNKFIKVLRYFNVIILCFWYIKLNIIKFGYLCSF